MFDKKAQGLSITTIIVAVIGLIVLVVIIAILTGKLGLFSAGLESVASCENACNALGKEFDKISTKDACSGQYVSGFSADKEGEGCCCKSKSSAEAPDCDKTCKDWGGTKSSFKEKNKCKTDDSDYIYKYLSGCCCWKSA